MNLPAVGTALAAPESMAASPVVAASNLLGGVATLRKRVRTRLDIHEIIERGIPGSAFNFLVAHVTALDPADVHKAVGVSLRTVQRKTLTPRKPLSVAQSARAWQFAEILAHATAVLGTQEAAEQWLAAPAVGLDQRRPIELLSTPVGAELVTQLLGRIESGVYS